MNRRDFMRLIGVSAAAAAVPAVLVPERRIWQVPANAPVGKRISLSRPLSQHAGYLVTFADGDSMVVPYEKLAGVRTPSGAPVVAYERWPITDGRQQRLFGVDGRGYESWQAATFRAGSLTRARILEALRQIDSGERNVPTYEETMRMWRRG